MQKIYPDILHRYYSILSHIKYNNFNHTQIAKKLNLKRQTIAYHIEKLVHAGYLTDTNPKINKWKFYKLTDLGQKFLAGYEATEKQNLVGTENARWKTKIRNSRNLQKFLFEHDFRYHQMENWIQWIGKIDNFSIQVNIGRETTMVVTHPPHYQEDLVAGFVKVQENIMNVFSNLNKKWNFDLSLPEPVPTRQFTIADPFSKELIDKYARSQIKINNDISFDASKHGEPRTEFGGKYGLQEAVDYASMPSVLKNMVNEQMKTNEKLEKMIETTDTHSKALESMMNQQNKQSEVLGELFEQIKGQSVQKNFPLSADAEKMFG